MTAFIFQSRLRQMCGLWGKINRIKVSCNEVLR